MVASGMSRLGVAKKLASPLQTTFAAAYRYGHTQAKGYDDGGPENHPRASTGGTNNMRVFFNPEF